MQSNNPVLTRYEKTDGSGFAYDEGRAAYAQAATGGAGIADTETAFQTITAGGGARLTINDVVVKGLLVFGITVVFAVVGWNTVDTLPWLMWVGMLGGLALGFVNALKKVPSPPLIMLYAVLQGVFLGGISNWYNEYALGSGWEGIVLQAVIATMTTFGVMLTLYLTGVIKVTKKFQSIMMVALVSYLLLGVASLVAALFGVGGGWGFYGVDGIGLAISVIGVLIAAFFLLLDFEAINQGITHGAPERESWRMAFGLLVTLIWIYLEFLRLLAIFGGRD
jgi:uncharacterized YccA/Bax inhibitor family protein